MQREKQKKHSGFTEQISPTGIPHGDRKRSSCLPKTPTNTISMYSGTCMSLRILRQISLAERSFSTPPWHSSALSHGVKRSRSLCRPGGPLCEHPAPRLGSATISALFAEIPPSWPSGDSLCAPDTFPLQDACTRCFLSQIPLH